jgi:AAA+ ATPase superfamily predicted ATPase
MPNPYSFGPLVTNPDMFFGREAELETLCTRLRNMQSTSVVGLRRIGKSSLLYQFAQALPDTLGQNFVPLYINLQDARFDTMYGFVSQVCKTFNKKVGGILSTRNVTGMSGFSEAIDKLNSNSVRPVLCLDEFEELTGRPEEFNDGFFEALRALGQHAKLGIVTASRTPLTALIRSGGLTSPLPNIFSHIELGLLESEAAQALRRIPFERENIELSSEDEALVEDLAGRHPCYLQMASYHLYEAQSQSPSKRANMVRDNFNRDAKPHFERLWEHLGAGDKAVLRVVMDQAVRTSETERKLKRLAYLGLVEQTDGNWQIFSAAFAEYVRRRPVEAPRFEEPVEPGAPYQVEEVTKSRPMSTATTLIIGFLILLTLLLLAIGALTNSVSFILLSAVSAGLLLFMVLWYRPTDATGI